MQDEVSSAIQVGRSWSAIIEVKG